MQRREFLQMIAAGAAFSITGDAFSAPKYPEGVGPDSVSATALHGRLPGARMAAISSRKKVVDPHVFRFDRGGSFTFLQISDVQDYRKLHPRAKAVFERAVEKFSPSLVVMTGDNVDSCNCLGWFEETMLPLAKMFTDAGMPFALTMGNHDTQRAGKGWYTGEEEWIMWKKAGGQCFVDFDTPGLPGIGNGVIPVLGSGTDTKARFNIFIADSGDYGDGGYDGCHTEQIKWFTETNDRSIPALWFQHIPVMEMSKDNGLYHIEDQPFPGAIKAFSKWRGPNLARTVGALKEGCSCQTGRGWPQARYLYDGKTLYQHWIEAGNIKGAYFGHDHKNAYDGIDNNGMRLGYCKALTIHSYNDRDPGLRVFTVHPDGTYETDTISEKHPDGTGFYGRKSPIA